MKLSGAPGKLGVFGLVMALGAGSAMAQARAGDARDRTAQGGQAQADDRELIGHALSMAIESSGLMLTAQQGGYGRNDYGSGGTSRGTSGAGTGTGGVPTGSSAGTENTSGAGTTAGSETGTTGSRTTGLSGQESYVVGNQSPAVGSSDGGTAATGRDGRETYAGRGGLQGAAATGGAGLQGAGPARREVDYRPGAVAGSAGMVGNVASQLQQHARRGFEDSERLFREAARRVGDGNSPTGRYLTAAWDYAHTLESMVGWSSGASGTGSSGAGAGRAGAGAASGAMASGRGVTGPSDMQWACLANHGVKEVLDGSKIKAMCRLMGNRGEATETLRQHAQQMHTEGMRLVQSLAASAGPTARREPRGTGTGESLLDAATARTRDRDVTSASGARAGTDTTRIGAAGTGGAAGTAAGGTTGLGSGGGGTGTAGPGASGTRGDATITLAQQAQELIRVIDELDNGNR